MKLRLTTIAMLASALAGCGPAPTTNNMAAPTNEATTTPNTTKEAEPAPAAEDGAPSAAVSGAAQQNFSVINNTSKTVLTLHVSSVTDQNWGPDILGSSVIAPGSTASVTFPRTESQCNWDVRAVYTDSTNAELRNVNLCEVATVTLVE